MSPCVWGRCRTAVCWCSSHSPRSIGSVHGVWPLNLYTCCVICHLPYHPECICPRITHHVGINHHACTPQDTDVAVAVALCHTDTGNHTPPLAGGMLTHRRSTGDQYSSMCPFTSPRLFLIAAVVAVAMVFPSGFGWLLFTARVRLAFIGATAPGVVTLSRGTVCLGGR